uniref:(northern house mosquito) hypothetical protein n=1 Tax=Culex pipiens TaxID=7175 RepID=A0A8D8L206_CULPI
MTRIQPCVTLIPDVGAYRTSTEAFNFSSASNTSNPPSRSYTSCRRVFKFFSSFFKFSSNRFWSGLNREIYHLSNSFAVTQFRVAFRWKKVFGNYQHIVGLPSTFNLEFKSIHYSLFPFNLRCFKVAEFEARVVRKTVVKSGIF